MASLGRPGAVPILRCPVVFNGNNWGEFSFHMEIHMGGQQLWGYLTGERPCPPTLTAPILFASMEVDISMSLRGLSTSHLMWAHLRRNYEIRNEALYLAVVEEAQSLRQHDSTVEEFHRQMSAVWHRLDILGAEFYASGTCQCCDRHRSQRETLRLHEFLSRLRPEFEVVRSQLLTRRPRLPLDEAMPELRAEETRLRAGA